MTEERMTPAPDARRAPAAGSATVIVCGRVPGIGVPIASPAPACYQALGPWDRPDSGLPGFHIGTPPVATPLPGGSPALAGLLAGTRWLLLVVGPGHDSRSLALTLASWARARGLRIAALQALTGATSALHRHALMDGVHYACACPPELDMLAAARALALGAAAEEAGDRADVGEWLRGHGQLHWLPAQAALAGPAVASAVAHALFAVQVGDDSGPDIALPAAAAHARCQRLPAGAGLPAGTYLFSA